MTELEKLLKSLTDKEIDDIFDAQYKEYGQLCDRLDMQLFARTVIAASQKPIDMVLHCPACGMQHIDKADEIDPYPTPEKDAAWWGNPPHRSHLCRGCGHIWRPADVPTNGVEAVKTRGKNDSPIAAPPCGQVNDGHVCPTPRRGDERLCPDCNPRGGLKP